MHSPLERGGEPTSEPLPRFHFIRIFWFRVSSRPGCKNPLMLAVVPRSGNNTHILALPMGGSHPYGIH